MINLKTFLHVIKKPLKKPYDKVTGSIRKQESNKQLIEYLKNINVKEVPLFNFIELETINRCNGSCQFCPVNSHREQRTYSIMSEPLFYRIIEQLRQLNYSGYIGLYSNNEPFLDNRIEKFIAITKEYLTNACHYIITNGTLLTLDKFKRIIDHLDYIIINNYDDSFEFNQNVKSIYNFCLINTELQSKVKIFKRSVSQILTTRGGTAPNRKKFKASGWLSGVSCQYPFTQMIVRPDGKISLCCNDALGKYTLGDLNENTIIDVWNNNKYYGIRKKLLEGRRYIDLCSRCDEIPEDWVINPAEKNYWDRFEFLSMMHPQQYSNIKLLSAKRKNETEISY